MSPEGEFSLQEQPVLSGSRGDTLCGSFADLCTMSLTGGVTFLPSPSPKPRPCHHQGGRKPVELPGLKNGCHFLDM